MLRLRPKKDFDCVLELFGGYGLQKRNTAAFTAIILAVTAALDGAEDAIQTAADRMFGGRRDIASRLIQDGLEYLRDNTDLLAYLSGGPVGPDVDAAWLVDTVLDWFEDHAIMDAFDPKDPIGRLMKGDELPPVYVMRCAPPPVLDVALEAEDGAS
ncbi:hypothetical protein [Pseudoflavonifractor phocaeensis]|uniref:hypothetical protein n=1 Tax=Pseudoflavonifractor phocaeensis TaxID=1870988 RepID=UPI002108F12F|nr:hypothetical protein [Pseudoflavonifractor phocaeensis]MCQ4862729.1 hypothetical protein [Pseudoflavonifractor phocaeensis]